MTPNEAYRIVRSAIAKGDLVRPIFCERCGMNPGRAKDGRSLIHAHHSDYDRPLDVEWLCVHCHRIETPLPSKPGGKSVGSKNGQAKLCDEDVFAMRSLRSKGWTYKSIAAAFRVDKKTAMRACKGEQWAHVPIDQTESLNDARQ